jgi:hypothetical protein
MENKKVKWYESGNIITTLIIITILAAIFCSQSFAVAGESSFSIFSSVINHNSLYLLVLVYFVLLKTRFGKRNFNYLNVFLVFIYVIATFTSALTLMQSFSLNTILGFLENVVLLLYLFHTMFRDTRVWKDYKLGNSPFNELKNDGYYYALFVLVAFSLAVNLISTVVVSGLFISILDALYLLLFGRFIYLYREYLDFHKLDSDNKGNFNELRDSINDGVSDAKEKIDNVLDKTDIDEKIGEAAKKVKDTTQNILDKTDIDEKIGDTVQKAVDEVKKVIPKEEKVEEKEVKKKKRVTKTKKGEDK